MLVFFVLCGMGLVRGLDIPECIGRVCSSNSICRMVVDSTTGVLTPKCVKTGYCPEPPQWEGLLSCGKQCQRQCEEDTDCPRRQLCCNDFFGCGKKCRDPLPINNCEHHKCDEGQSCVMTERENFPVPTCLNSTCQPPCERGLKCEMDVDPSCTQAPCPLVPRCLAKDPYCSPSCLPGHSCLLLQAAGCITPPCPKVPQCRPQCLSDPGGINWSNCIVVDTCSHLLSATRVRCPDGLVCCPTDCGRRCLAPRRL